MVKKKIKKKQPVRLTSNVKVSTGRTDYVDLMLLLSTKKAEKEEGEEEGDEEDELM